MKAGQIEIIMEYKMSEEEAEAKNERVTLKREKNFIMNNYELRKNKQ